jgi:hypothetical protein
MDAASQSPTAREDQQEWRLVRSAQFLCSARNGLDNGAAAARGLMTG